MALTQITTAWQVLTDGTNNGICSAPGIILLYIGNAAPTNTDKGIPFSNEKIQVGSPAKSWVKTADVMPVDAIIFTY